MHNFAFVKFKTIKVMSNQVLIWSVVILAMIFLFVIREANKIKRATGNNKLFEISDEYTIYSYDEDDN